MNLELSRNTMKDFFEGTVEKHSDRPCLAFAGKKPWTYAETAERVWAFQETLRNLGVKQGNPVIILGPSSPNWAVAYLALTTMGAVAVPVLDEFPETDIDHIIKHSEAEVVCVARSLFQSLCLPSIQKDQPVVILDDLSV